TVAATRWTVPTRKSRGASFGRRIATQAAIAQAPLTKNSRNVSLLMVAPRPAVAVRAVAVDSVPVAAGAVAVAVRGTVRCAVRPSPELREQPLDRQLVRGSAPGAEQRDLDLPLADPMHDAIGLFPEVPNQLFQQLHVA